MFNEKLGLRDCCRRKRYSLVKQGVHPLQRIVGAFRLLGCGAAGAMDGLVRVSTTTMLTSLLPLRAAIVDEFGSEYLRPPNEERVERIHVIKERRSFLGCVTSIDSHHWE